MGEVWLVKDIQLQTTWAMKLLRIDCEIEQYQAFIVECEILARLHHPAIPRIVDRFTTSLHHVVVMDFIDGVPITSVPAPSEATLLNWALQILGCIAYLHEREILYCDLKPQNIMIKETCIYIIDFGAAIASSNMRATRYGTIGYAAPEQERGSSIDKRIDIHAFGKTLIALHLHIFSNHEILILKNTNLSKPLKKIIAKCIKDEPSMRYATISELHRDLQSIKTKQEDVVSQRQLILRLRLLIIVFTGFTLGCIGLYHNIRNAYYQKAMQDGDYVKAIEYQTGNPEPYLRYYTQVYRDAIAFYRTYESYDEAIKHAHVDALKRLDDLRLFDGDVSENAYLHYEIGKACLESGNSTYLQIAYTYHFEVAKKDVSIEDAELLQNMAYYASKGAHLKEEERIERKRDLHGLYQYYLNITEEKKQINFGISIAQLYETFVNDLDEEEFHTWQLLVEGIWKQHRKIVVEQDRLYRLYQLSVRCYMEYGTYLQTRKEFKMLGKLYENVNRLLEQAEDEDCMDVYLLLNDANAYRYRYQYANEKDLLWIHKAKQRFQEVLLIQPSSTIANVGVKDCDRLLNNE